MCFVRDAVSYSVIHIRRRSENRGVMRWRQNTVVEVTKASFVRTSFIFPWLFSLTAPTSDSFLTEQIPGEYSQRLKSVSINLEGFREDLAINREAWDGSR